jgi:hypothetical protein
MSWSIWLEDFDFPPAGNDKVIRSILEPLLDEPRNHVVTADGSAEIYGLDNTPLTGLSFNRVRGQAIYELIYDVAFLGNWVVIPQDCAACLIHEDQAGALPAELTDQYGYRVVNSGADIRAVVQAS